MAEGTDGIGIADATFADLDGILGQKLGETEAVLDIRHKRTEVAVVDAAEVGAEVGVLQLRLGVHLEEHFKTEGVSLIQETLAVGLRKTGGDEQHGGGTTQGSSVELRLIDDEVLI